jgi:hypothetical protein
MSSKRCACVRVCETACSAPLLLLKGKWIWKNLKLCFSS